MTRPGRHFLQIPGPTNVPDRVLRAMGNPTIDHRGPDFATLGKRALDGMKRIVKTTAGQVIIYPASGTGAWEAALVNTCSPGDKVVMFETGHFAWLWEKLARRIGLEPEVIGSDWRRAADPNAIETALKADSAHEIKAICVVQNETSTGSATRVDEVRAAIDAGCRFTIDSDAHVRADWQHLVWGTAIARRGWVTPDLVANTLPCDDFVALMREKPHRV